MVKLLSKLSALSALSGYLLVLGGKSGGWVRKAGHAGMFKKMPGANVCKILEAVYEKCCSMCPLH